MTWRQVLINVLLTAALPLESVGQPVQELPFELREGLVWVEAGTSTGESLNFLVDTGAGVSVLNLPTAKRLGLRLGSRVSVQGVGAAAAGYWPQELAVRAGGVVLPERYLAVDLTALSGACRCRVDGLLGADFFRGRVMELDFAAGKLRIHANGWAPAGQEAVGLRSRRGALEVVAKVNGGKREWFRLDTGCASALQWVSKAPLELAADSEPRAEISGSKSAADGKDRESKMERVESVGLAAVEVPMMTTTVQLGRFCFTNVPTGVHQRALFPGEAGLLGTGLLSHFRSVTIDAEGGRLWLGGAQKF